MKKYLYTALIILCLGLSISIFQACSSDDPTVGTPTVDSFTLYTDQGISDGGPVGTLVKLTGTYFSADGTNTVKFNGVEASIIKSKTSVSSLTAIVPAGATTGKVSVTVGTHTGTSTKDFTVTSGTAAPAITGYTPDSGNGVDSVELTINGVNFSTTAINNIVKINGVYAGTPTKATATSLTVIVPSGATTGKITVEVDGVTGIAANEKDHDFKVPSPTIDKFTPTYSVVGGTVEITGTKFSKSADYNIVKFNGTQAQVDSVNVKDPAANFIIVRIPLNATTGKITLTIDNNLIGTSKTDFTVN